MLLSIRRWGSSCGQTGSPSWTNYTQSLENGQAGKDDFQNAGIDDKGTASEVALMSHYRRIV